MRTTLGLAVVSLALCIVCAASSLAAPDPVEAAVRLYVEGHLEEAERAFRAVLSSSQASMDGQGLSHKFLGNIFLVRGEPEAALREYEAALALFRQSGNVSERANTLSNQARLEEQRRRFDVAATLYAQVLTSDREARDVPAEASTLLAIGDLHRAQAHAAEARRSYEQALRLLQGVPTGASRLPPASRRDARGLVLLSLGTLFLDEGRFDEAEVQYKAALDAFRKSASPSGRAKAHYQLGRLSWRRGHYEEAQSDALAAMAAAGETSLPAPRGDIYNLLGLISEDLGQLRSALAWYQKAVASYGRDRQRLAATLQNIGNVHLRFGALDDADRAFEQAAASYAAVNDKTGAALAANGQGIVALRRASGGRGYDEAVRLFEAAALAAADGRDGGVRAQALNNLAYAHFLAGRLGQAEQSAAAAAGLAARDPNTQVAMLALRGAILTAQQRREEAVVVYGEAIALVEQMRGSLHQQELKATFLEDKAQLYDLQIGLLAELDRPAELLETLERARSRAFLDLLGNQRLRAREGAEVQTLAERELHLQQEMATAAGEADLRAATEEHRAVLTRLRKLDPEYASQRGVDPIRAADIERGLDERTALVEYYIGRSQVIAAVATRGGVRVVRLAVTPDQLNRLIDEAHDFIADRHAILKPQWQQVMFALHKVLWAPLEPALGGRKRVCIVPYGGLNYLSMAALVSKLDDSGGPVPAPRFLVEDYTLFYSPSASVLSHARAKNPMKLANALVLGNALTELRPLPASEAEARAISTILPQARLFVREAATETRVKQDGPTADVIHLATHGELHPEAPMESRILLTRTTADDGYLTVSEIFRLRLKAYLVVLSACESGEVAGMSQVHDGVPPGDDLVGLTRSFLYAGTPSIVASLWPVDDLATSFLMTSFYRSLGRGGDKAEALRRAQLALIELGRKGTEVTLAGHEGPLQTILFKHPNEWAPFILVGDDR